jgi:hypothetical protein
MDKNVGGRPLTEIDYKTLSVAARLMATGEECASELGIDYDTLNAGLIRDGHGGFSEFLKKHSGRAKISLRRSMFKLALEGENPTMQIWLSKQHLGFSDKIEEKSTQVHLQTEFDFSTLNDEQRGMMRNLLKSNDKDGA